jgi:antitoxin PrlF
VKTKRVARNQEGRKAPADDQRYFWSAEWQRGELEASADIAKGRVKSFNDAAALIEDLHRRLR